MRRAVLLTIVALSLACTNNPRATAVAPAMTTLRNPEFTNVQVLSHQMSREQLIQVMRRFTQALGVGCDHCHVVTATTPRQQFDFPSDAKETKRVARVMIQMTQQINGPLLERVEEAEGHAEEAAGGAGAAFDVPRVGCWTCHRGNTEPEMPPPLPPRS